MRYQRVEPVGPPSQEQTVDVERLLGRPAAGRFDIAVVNEAGEPVVIRNAPLQFDGRPMPTLYWLVGRDECLAVSRLEGAGGVRRAEAEVDPARLEATHARYAAARDAEIDPAHGGPRPSGGVGGTRTGVKCLHTHLAHQLACGDDPVGEWVIEQLGWTS